jgi:hypothetical protein
MALALRSHRRPPPALKEPKTVRAPRRISQRVPLTAFASRGHQIVKEPYAHDRATKL